VRKLVGVSALEGSWNVRRTGGLLPPLIGVRKRIEGSRGETRVGRIAGVPFDVVGLELHYRRPFSGFVDVLTAAGDGFTGRATFRGREFGRFEMTRSGG
jgi:hypothetical protein